MQWKSAKMSKVDSHYRRRVTGIRVAIKEEGVRGIELLSKNVQGNRGL